MNVPRWSNLIDYTAQIDDMVRVYGDYRKLKIGAHCRIDAFCVITVGEQGVEIGDNVHIGAGVYIFGSSGKVTIGDGCSLSPRSTIYTATDDFRKAGLIGPCNPEAERNIIKGDVTMEEDSALGHGAVLFPGAVLARGATVGAYCLITKPVRANECVTREQACRAEERQ